MQVPYVVIDTNIVVSAHLRTVGLERRVYDESLAENLHLFITPQIFAEYEEVLRRPKFPFTRNRIDQSLQLIRQRSTLIAPTRTLFVSPDERDNRFLECAEAARADFLVTGNRRHYPAQWGKTRIVNARELLDEVFPIRQD